MFNKLYEVYGIKAAVHQLRIAGKLALISGTLTAQDGPGCPRILTCFHIVFFVSIFFSSDENPPKS